MRSVQVSKANGAFEMIEKNILPEPNEAKFALRFKHAAYAMAILLQNKACFQVYNIQESQAGMEVIVVNVNPADVEILSCASLHGSQEFLTMVDIQTI
jgi:spore coat protein CotF